ncbi:MAG: FKBP-type peptidyl-prolyl cis-trans isomerase [Bacteroidales bacterium]|nr:FKBP-type peptidyl-prolyl cis-trans isomerase [Bacteroidales bacterium]MDD4655884.1 FKBP-type peptidyl-prolyl cis-trans isomerase [Bacteroidales bacterium]
MIQEVIKLKNYWLIVLLSIVTVSCAQQDLDNITTQQETEIEEYVKDLGALEVVVNNGVWRAVMERGEEGEENKVAKGDSIVFNYAGYVFRSGKGNLYDTNVFSLAETLGTTQDYNYFVPREGIVGKGRLISGLDIGLIGAQVGERCYVIFSSRHGFGNIQTGMIPKMSPLLIEVWILAVKKN